MPIDLLDAQRDHRPRKQQLTEAQKKAKAAAIAAAAKQRPKSDWKKHLDPHALRDAKGITYHINHLRKLWNRDEFPPPFNMSTRRIAWEEPIIDAWFEAKKAGIDWRLVKEAMGK